MLAGRRPARLALRDWLDAGYVVLVEGVDPDARALLDDLFAAETEEQFLDRSRALRAETETRAAEQADHRRRHDAERAKRGYHTWRRAPEGAAQGAADEWDAVIESSAPPPAAE